MHCSLSLHAQERRQATVGGTSSGQGTSGAAAGTSGRDTDAGGVWTLADLFAMFDADGSGYVDYNEFQELCKYMGLFLNNEAMIDLFAKADSSGNNQIEYKEFRHALDVLKKEIAQ